MERFSRSTLLQSGIDFNRWKTPDLRALSSKEKETVERRLSALKAFFTQKTTNQEIKHRYGVAKSTLYSMIKTAIQLDDEGEYVGYRASLLNYRLKSNKRIAEITPRGDSHHPPGDAGLFSKLLFEYPKLEALMRRYGKIYKSRAEGGVKRLIELHSDFLKECVGLGISAPQYPFTREDQGRRSFERHLHEFRREYAESVRAKDRGVEDLAVLSTTEPLQEVEVDGHNLDVRVTVQEVDTFGLTHVYELLTLWVILVIDSYTRCVLGYSLALGGNYDQTDLLTAIYNSIAPHKRPPAVVPALSYKSKGGFPNEKIPELAWSYGAFYKLDNAMAHKAKFAEQTLRKIVGCFEDFGPPHTPNARAIVESFFRYLVDNFSHRIIGTTGAHPKDEIIKRLSPKGGDLSLLLTVDELNQALDVFISDYNGRPHSGIAPHSPLELFVRSVHERDLVFPCLRMDQRELRKFTQKTSVVKVRSDGVNGAFINFKGVRYRNLPVLKFVAGSEVMIEWDPLNISFLRVYDLRNGFLGEIFPPPPWISPHSEKLRARLRKSLKKGQIFYKEGESVADLLRSLQQAEGWRERAAATYNLKHTGSVTLPVSSRITGNATGIPSARLEKGYIVRRNKK